MSTGDVDDCAAEGSSNKGDIGRNVSVSGSSVSGSGTSVTGGLGGRDTGLVYAENSYCSVSGGTDWSSPSNPRNPPVYEPNFSVTSFHESCRWLLQNFRVPPCRHERVDYGMEDCDDGVDCDRS